MSFFDELKASLEEAVEIKNGTKAPARVTATSWQMSGLSGKT